MDRKSRHFLVTLERFFCNFLEIWTPTIDFINKALKATFSAGITFLLSQEIFIYISRPLVSTSFGLFHVSFSLEFKTSSSLAGS